MKISVVDTTDVYHKFSYFQYGDVVEMQGTPSSSYGPLLVTYEGLVRLENPGSTWGRDTTEMFKLLGKLKVDR